MPIDHLVPRCLFGLLGDRHGDQQEQEGAEVLKPSSWVHPNILVESPIESQAAAALGVHDPEMECSSVFAGNTPG